ncbi:MAG: phosphatidylserine/phosphatidylglycerophosphate/cardiolipin synthase family protein [Myxococcales bacterium]|nr:phosphatidylserine/phosphatidylglycerophosphate/cardiolipin synthase family protein [Myxococcales bacterium]
MLRDGRRVFPAMLDAITSARRTICLEMYWVEDDVVGARFRDALVAASRAGVSVRVIVDAVGSFGLPEDFWAPLEAVGGRARVFRPLSVTAAAAALARDHRKILVVDDERAFVGGVNLAAQWLPISEGGENWRDTALEVRGPELPLALRAVFDTTWHRFSPGQLQEPPAPLVWTSAGGKLRVLANSPLRRQGRKIRQSYVRAIRRARYGIDLTAAYFAPRPSFIRSLHRAAQRGVRVRVLLPLKSDVLAMRLAAEPLARLLATLGVEVYGYVGGVLHAKTAVVDGSWLTVGSHNLDAWSWLWNLECNVVVIDPAMGARAVDMFEEDLRLSVRLAKGSIVPAGRLDGVVRRVIELWYGLG